MQAPAPVWSVSSKTQVLHTPTEHPFAALADSNHVLEQTWLLEFFSLTHCQNLQYVLAQPPQFQVDAYLSTAENW